jgi:hypothetical protein
MSNQYQYLWERIAGPDPNLRAADADRERVADRLRKAHGEGRLDLGEFQDRLDRCYQAKTLGELRQLVGDLPREDAQVAPRSVGVLQHAAWRVPLVPIVIALVVISAAAGHGHHAFWIWVPLIFLFCRLSWWRRRSWSGPRQRTDDWL